MNHLTLERLNPESLGGVPTEELAQRIRQSPTGWPEMNGTDHTYHKLDAVGWEELTMYESIVRHAGGFTIWTCVDGFTLEGYSSDPESFHPDTVTTVHLPKGLAFGD